MQQMLEHAKKLARNVVAYQVVAAGNVIGKQQNHCFRQWQKPSFHGQSLYIKSCFDMEQN